MMTDTPTATASAPALTAEPVTEGVLTTAPAAPAVEAPVEAKPSLTSLLYPDGDKPADPAPVLDPPLAPAEAEAKPKVEGAPAEAVALTVESYKDLALPDGLTVDDALFTKAKETFAKVGIDPALAPELLALYGETQQQQLTSLRAEITAQDARWTKELDAIPEFSGEQRAVAQQFIGRAIEEFGTPEVRSILGAYGLSNNPALARFVYNLAHAVMEGEPTRSGSPAPIGKGQSGRTPLAESLYDHPDSAKARTQ